MIFSFLFEDGIAERNTFVVSSKDFPQSMNLCLYCNRYVLRDTATVQGLVPSSKITSTFLQAEPGVESQPAQI